MKQPDVRDGSATHPHATGSVVIAAKLRGDGRSIDARVIAARLRGEGDSIEARAIASKLRGEGTAR